MVLRKQYSPKSENTLIGKRSFSDQRNCQLNDKVKLQVTTAGTKPSFDARTQGFCFGRQVEK